MKFVRFTKQGSSVFLAVVLFLVSTPVLADSTCPSTQVVHDGIKRVFNRDIEIREVVPSKVAGLCEAHAFVGGRYNIIYIDSVGKRFVIGNVIDIGTGKDITEEVVRELNKLSVEDIEKLRELTAFTLGDKGPEIFYVMDPQCPFCKKGLPVIKKLTKEGKLTVHILLFPLPFHEGADKESIAVICDNKGIEGVESQYVSNNQCEEGKNKIQGTLAFLSSKGINGTPSYIFADGRVHVGVVDSEEDLLELVEKAR